MKTRIVMIGKKGNYKASAIYENGNVYIQPGSIISLSFAEHIRGGRKALSYRNNPQYVDQNGKVLKECEFSSASTAAQFVTGRSTNGLERWYVEPKVNLKKWIEMQTK